MSGEPEARRPFNARDRLADYVDVKARVLLFYEKYPDGRLVTSDVRMATEPDGKPRVIVEAIAYRTPDDPLPGRGWSWMELPGRTPYTHGSELENTETSAWGRAIAATGIGIDRSIASKDEVDAKSGDKEAATDAARDRALGTLSTFTPEGAFDAGLIGTAEKGSGDADFELRQTADRGPRIAFRIVEGRQKLKVETFGPLAELIAQNRAAIEGQRVTCWGAMRDETFTPKATKPDQVVRPITYHVLGLERIKAGTLDLTAPEPDEEPDELTGEEREMADLTFPVTA